MPSDKLMEQIRLSREKKEREEAAKAAAETHAPELIPEVPYEKTEADKELDAVIDRIDILDAYKRWCNKGPVPPTYNRRDGIKLRCPNPAHKDANPSFSVNLDKQTGKCFECEVGYDSKDIAAFHFGYPVPHYKTNGDFPNLLRDMAGDYGYAFKRTIGGEYYLDGPPEPNLDNSEQEHTSPTNPTLADNSDIPDTSQPPSLQAVPDISDKSDISGDAPLEGEDNRTDNTNIVDLYTAIDEEYDFAMLPHLDWRTLLPQDTFLRSYMEQASQDDLTEEFHFFNALVTLSFALNTQVRLLDSRPVHSNLFVCTLGRTGSGKSQAQSYMWQILRNSMPFNAGDDFPAGVNRISSPSSGETMIDAFNHQVKDPASKAVIGTAPIKGLIDFNELSVLMSKGDRTGNPLKPVMMQFYDRDPDISTRSRAGGYVEAKDAFASATTTTQPRSLRDLVSKSDDSSGFLNRWLFVGGPEKKRASMGGYVADMTPAITLFDELIGWAASFSANEFVTLDDMAFKKWDEFFHDRLTPERERAFAQGSELFARIDLTCKKMMLLLAGNAKLRVIPEWIIDQVIYIYDFLCTCYSIPATELGNTTEHQITRSIEYQLKRINEQNGGNGATAAAIAKAMKNSKFPKKDIVLNLELMIKLGFVIEIMETGTRGRGRPATRYKYVD